MKCALFLRAVAPEAEELVWPVLCCSLEKPVTRRDINAMQLSIHPIKYNLVASKLSEKKDSDRENDNARDRDSGKICEYYGACY